jgi:hypothetical protein
MMRRIWNFLNHDWGGSIFSARGLVTSAALLTGLFLVLHLCGLRENLSFLCGTSPTGNPADQRAFYWGAVYLLLYFGVVLVAPILLIAAGLLKLLRRFSRETSPPDTAPTTE